MVEYYVLHLLNTRTAYSVESESRQGWTGCKSVIWSELEAVTFAALMENLSNCLIWTPNHLHI
jgi:hypothetical protein